jgi:subtilase family serine protease
VKRVGFGALLALGAFIAGCSGGGGGATKSLPATNPIGDSNASVPSQLLVSSWGSGVMQGASYVGPVTNANMSVTVLVHQQNAQGLVQYAQQANDPTSANYRHWLTPQQIAQQYGASQTDYQKVANYFVSNGLTIASWQQRMVLVVGGSQTNLQRAFGTTFGMYQRNGKEFIAPKTAPHFAQVLPVDAIGQIANYKPNHTYLIPAAPRAAAGYTSGFSPSTLQAAFDYAGAYKSNYNGTGVTIAIIGSGPIDTTSTGTGDVDLNQYALQTNAAAASITFKLVTTSGVQSGLSTSGISASQFPYSPTFGPTPGANWNEQNEDGEAQLDTQQAATLAPRANVYFYLAYNANDGCTNASFATACPSGSGSAEYGIDETDPEIQQVISDDEADVVSMSFGGGEQDQGWTCYSGCEEAYKGSYSQLEFAALAAEGIAAFAASGDDGAAECYLGSTYNPSEQCVSYPSGDPNVTSVGGITANVDLSGAITAPWLAWGISTSDNGYGATQGSGGGTALYLPAPTWQASVLGAAQREQPDVSLDGDPSTGVSYVVQGQLSGVGGTSVSTPGMAAMWADLLSACIAHPSQGVCTSNSGSHGYRLGVASRYLYGIYGSSIGKSISGISPSLPYSNVFYDIIYGDNEMYSNPGSASPVPSTPVPGFSAGPGFDEVTGVGVPFAGHLIQSLTNQAVQ